MNVEFLEQERSQMEFRNKKRDDQAKKIVFAVGLALLGLNIVSNERLAELLGLNPWLMPPALRTGIIILDLLFVPATLFLLVQHKSKKKILIDAAVGLGFTLILLLAMEGVFYYLNSQPHRQRQVGPVVFEFINDVQGPEVKFAGEHAQAFYRRDDWLGYALVPNMQVRASRKSLNGDRLLYDVSYTVDAEGRRVTPMADPDQRSAYILFFGDSFTFGEGVNDAETMPAVVAQLAPHYKSYNYGAGGYGPQHMLAQLQRAEMKTEVGEDDGILVYTFIFEHIGRAIGAMRIHAQRGDVMPYYYIDRQNNLVRQGDFASGRPLVSVLYTAAGASQTLRFFNIDLPPRLRAQDLEITARLLEESRDIYRQKFGSDQFLVVIYPGLGQPELLPYLQAAGIRYLDYSALPAAVEPDFWLGEGHPTAKAHKMVAEKLVQDLGLAGSPKD
jgi:hypothetical protein